MPIDSGANQEKPPVGQGLSSHHHTTKRMLGFKKEIFHTEEAFANMLETSLRNPEDTTYKNKIISQYNKLYQTHMHFTDEEALINRMERSAHLRNTLFRGITTIVIGISIMLVYWVASYFEIPMPLMRVPQ